MVYPLDDSEKGQDSIEYFKSVLPGKVTPEYISQNIVSVEYFIVGKTTTICAILTRYDYVAVGVSSCVDEKNFDRRKGEEIAYQKAFDQLFEPFGFNLKVGHYTLNNMDEMH